MARRRYITMGTYVEAELSGWELEPRRDGDEIRRLVEPLHLITTRRLADEGCENDLTQVR